MRPSARPAYSVSSMVLFILSLVYLGLELVFNRQLLDISSSVRSPPEAMERVQEFGRICSGLGFTLLVLGIFQPWGFRVRGWKRWAVFALLAAACLMPAGMLLWGRHAVFAEGYGPFLPVAGAILALACRGRKRFIVIPALILMAWPAMFHGQKLAIERFVVAPTTVENRLNARYILLLQSGIEDCIILLEGVQFCDSTPEVDAEKRSTRAILGALFMLDTRSVFKSLSFSREQLIDSIAEQDMWFSSKEYYRRYLEQVAEKRGAYVRAVDSRYYLPYKRVSDIYRKAYDDAFRIYRQASQPGRFEKIADDAARQIESETERGWQQYSAAAEDYKKASAGRASSVQQGVYGKLCAGRESLCSRFRDKKYKGMTVDGAMARLQASQDAAFYERTGYPPNIRSKEDFIRNEKTQSTIRARLEGKIREQVPGHSLPYGWTYSPASFRDDFLRLLKDSAQNTALTMASRAQKTWKEKVEAQFGQPIPPSLSREAFFSRFGGDPVPPLKDLAMSEEAFRKKYIVPINRKIADSTLKKMKDEAPSYADKGALEKKGKDYIRALYVPTIALCLSTLIITVTVGRYFSAALTGLLGRLQWSSPLARRRPRAIAMGCWAAFLALVLTAPYLWPNPYTATAAYRKYHHLASEKYPAGTFLLDWVLRMQPVVYRLGASMA